MNYILERLIETAQKLVDTAIVANNERINDYKTALDKAFSDLSIGGAADTVSIGSDILMTKCSSPEFGLSFVKYVVHTDDLKIHSIHYDIMDVDDVVVKLDIMDGIVKDTRFRRSVSWIDDKVQQVLDGR